MKKIEFRNRQSIFLFIYTLVIFWYAVFSRPISFQTPHFELFWSYKKWIQGDWVIGKQIVYNIIFFVPLGFLHSSITERKGILKAVLLGLSLSCLNEIFQYLFMRGLFEFDDVLNNTIGALIGGVIYKKLCKRLDSSATHIIAVNVGIFSVVIGFAVCIFSSSSEVDTSSRQYCFQIDEIVWKDENLHLTGFGFQYGTTNKPIQLTLKSDHQSISLDVDSGVKRQDVEAYFSCESDYLYTGFQATASGIEKNEEYEVFVNIGWPMAVTTGIYISGLDIHYYPSDKFVTPDININFVENGTLRVYRPDYHCWVYQYQGALYWIVDKDFYFEDDGSTYIQYQLWTTQPIKLPKKRIENGWDWDNIGGNFEDYEIEGDFGSYRIMKRNLPIDYSITSIQTGYHKDGKWVWQEFFRPIYEF